jgi:DNA-binding MarR family transcriptional regulator
MSMIDTRIETADRLRHAVGRIARRLRPTAAGAGKTPTTISVLFTIVREGPVRLSEVAEIEDLNPTMLSRIVGALADDGLIRRVADPADRRAAVVEATAAGRRLRQKVHKERSEALAVQYERLDQEDRDAIERALPALERLADLVKEASE